MGETYLLDTGILVGYVRDASYYRFVHDQYRPFEGDNIALVSTVSHGEIFSIAYQFGFSSDGERRSVTICSDSFTSSRPNQ